MEHETPTLPRDEFSVLLRQLNDNPGATHTQSRVDIADFYGRSQTWTIDTFRAEGAETVFVQRMSADGALRLVLPPEVTLALARQRGRATDRNRRQGARQAVATKRARGDSLGNPDALRKARRARKSDHKAK
jgi:hypothetical protein